MANTLRELAIELTGTSSDLINGGRSLSADPSAIAAANEQARFQSSLRVAELRHNIREVDGYLKSPRNVEKADRLMDRIFPIIRWAKSDPFALQDGEIQGAITKVLVDYLDDLLAIRWYEFAGVFPAPMIQQTASELITHDLYKVDEYGIENSRLCFVLAMAKQWGQVPTLENNHEAVPVKLLSIVDGVEGWEFEDLRRACYTYLMHKRRIANDKSGMRFWKSMLHGSHASSCSSTGNRAEHMVRDEEAPPAYHQEERKARARGRNHRELHMSLEKLVRKVFWRAQVRVFLGSMLALLALGAVIAMVYFVIHRE